MMQARDNSKQNGIDTLQEMHSHIDELPVLPKVFVKTMRLDANSDGFYDKLEALIMEDPALVVRVLSMANSVLSSPTTPINSIRQALTRMGVIAIRGLIASLAVQRIFVPTDANQQVLWTHAINVAVGAQKIAQLIPALKVDPATAYVAGLLHDIGRFVMFEHASQELLRADESNWGTATDELTEAEIELFKYTHSELGCFACNQWKLPEYIALVIQMHHSDLEGKIYANSIESIAFCVQIADRLDDVILQDYENTQDNCKALIHEHCLRTEEERNFLSPDTLIENIEDINHESERVLSGLGFSSI